MRTYALTHAHAYTTALYYVQACTAINERDIKRSLVVAVTILKHIFTNTSMISLESWEHVTLCSEYRVQVLSAGNSPSVCGN